MKHNIGDLVKTEMWFGIIVAVEQITNRSFLETGVMLGTDEFDYKVYFFLPDDRALRTRWCDSREIDKWKKNLLDATK